MSFSALDSALTGPLFATDAMHACFSDQARLQAMLDVEAALARAEAGLVADGLAGAIAAVAPGRLDAAAIGRQSALAGVPTIPFVKAVQALLPPGMDRGFHKGATTQDILDTALVLQCRQAFGLIRAELGAIIDGLAALAQAHRATPCVGRTYGQHAAPVTFGFKAAVWLAGIADAARELPGARDSVLVASLGGPVGMLTSLGEAGPAVLEAFARELGLAASPITWHARRGRIARVGCWLAELIGALAKLATDVAHLASTEVAEVGEPFIPGRGGSSAMPHKRNPVSCTVILAAHAAAPGHAAALLAGMAAAHERPVGLWHAEWLALPTLFGLASGALREARVLAEGLEVDAARMRCNLDATRGLLFADAAAGLLTASLGRAAAHKAVEHASDAARAGGEGLQAVLSRAYPGVADAAFDLRSSIAAAGPWVERAIQDAATVQATLRAL